MKFNFQFGGSEFGFIFSHRKILTNSIQGVTNRTKDGFYVLFLDYDDMPLDWLVHELVDIQVSYALSDLYVFETSEEKYSVVAFDKLYREEYQDILSRSSCDPYYKKIPWTFGKRVATLRVSEKNGFKPRLKKIIEARESTYRKKSSAHIKFFESHLGIKTNFGDDQVDNEKDLLLAGYRI